MTTNIQPDWWTRTFSGLILGLALALALSGCFAWAGPGGIHAVDKVQFNMWVITPIWMLIFSFVFLFPTGRMAVFWLTAANVITWSALIGIRSTMSPL